MANGEPVPRTRPAAGPTTHPVLLLPALPSRHHAAPWLAQWECMGETQMEGMKLWAIEQRITDRHALLPVIVVLTGDKSDVISVDRFELRGGRSLQKEVSERLWEETRAVLKQSGARINETQQGAIPITALPSLPPSLSLVQIPGGDYREIVLQLHQNINLRRLGLGGRSGFRLANATPAQQLHFRQCYRLPMPPPSSTSSATASPSSPPLFTRTLLSLITLTQHALSLFGLGHVKSFLSPSVLSQLPPNSLPASPSTPSKLLEILDRSLLDALVRSSAGLPPGSAADSEAVPEDYADALGLPLSMFQVGTSSPSTHSPLAPGGTSTGVEDPLTKAGGASAPLLEGDGLLCDVTVSALALFRVEYAARLLSSSRSSSSAATYPTPTSAAVGNLLRDEAVLSPGLLAALLSLAVGARGKLIALGGGSGGGAGEGEAQGVPKDVFEKRGRFLACVGGFMKTSPSAPSSLPPVLTPSFLHYLHTAYNNKFRPASAPSSPSVGALSTLRGGLTSLASALPHRHNHDNGNISTPGGSDAEFSDAGALLTAGGSLTRRRRRSLHRPHLSQIPHPHLPLAFTRRTAGRNGEECETADLETFINETLAGGSGLVTGATAGEGKGKGKSVKGRGAGGRSVRGVWGYGSGAVLAGMKGAAEQGKENAEREREGKEERRERRRGRRTDEAKAARQKEEGRVADSMGMSGQGREAGIVEKPDGVLVPLAPAGASSASLAAPETRASIPSTQASSSLSRVPTSHTSYTAYTTMTAASAGASLGAGLGRGVAGTLVKGVRGVKEKAGRAKRKMEDGLGLTDSQNVLGEDKHLASADQGAVDERAKLVAPQVVVSPDSGDRSPAGSSPLPPSSPDEEAKENQQSTASRASTFASRLASALTPPQLNPPTFGHHSSHSSSRQPSPSAAAGEDGRAKLRLDTNLNSNGSKANSVKGGAGSVASGSRANSVSGSPTTVRTTGTGRLLSPVDYVAAAKRPTGPRRTVSEMPPGELEERAVGRSFLFGGRGEEAGEETVDEQEEEGEHSSGDEEEDERVEDERIVFRPSPSRRPFLPHGPSSSSSSPSMPPRASLPLRRRHSITSPPSHVSSPEPWAWLSRRRLEIEVNLRWAAWELRRREQRLEEGKRGLEAVHKSYTCAIASLRPHLDLKTSTLSALTARSSALSTRLENLTSSSTSPLTKLSTGTSRLHYAQAVLDDKLHDVLTFAGQLQDKVGPEGSLERAARELEGERRGMRRLVGVLEVGVGWMGGWGRWMGWSGVAPDLDGGTKKREEEVQARVEQERGEHDETEQRALEVQGGEAHVSSPPQEDQGDV
ncbi:hypothetical protein JCM11251_006952 [Rhodosporidiobolus azoricus]